MALDGWDNDLGGVDTTTGEIHDATAEQLVAAITANPDALAALTQAINGDTKKDPLNVYATAAEFVELWFVRRFPQNLEHVTWCDHWWKHPEGRMVLEWMWESWEEERRVAGRLFGWYTHTCKPAVTQLLATDGPFAGCKHTTRHRDGAVKQRGEHFERHQRLPVGLAPDELFVPVPTKQNPNP